MEKIRHYKTSIILAVLAVAVLGIGYGMSTAVKAPSQPPFIAAGSTIDVPMVPANFSDLAEQVKPGVVNIQVVKKVQAAGLAFPGFPGNPFGEDSPFGRFFEQNPPMEQKQEGTGSGFIINADGHILTNNHVVEDAERIQVKLASGEEYAAKVVGRDPKTDLAVLKIDGAGDLHPLTLGNSDDLKVGSWVVAVGSPFGLEQTVTQGIVSGKGRVIGSGPYDDFIQTDASINPGNSGGPLVNMKGEVIGINTAIYPSGQGIGFAIPIDMAKSIVPQLEEKGSVTRGWLGVGIQEITPALEKSFDLNDKSGALVSDVSRGGPAEKAGIERGDVITRFDGKSVEGPKDLSRVVASTAVGKTVDVTVVRDGKPMDRTVKVGEMQDEKEMTATPSRKTLGITVREITPEIAGELGLKNNAGVVVSDVEPGSPAADAGIQSGDVIREVNRKPVTNVADFMREIEQTRHQDNVLMRIQRGDHSYFAALTAR
jgi:serine protease Do